MPVDKLHTAQLLGPMDQIPGSGAGEPEFLPYSSGRFVGMLKLDSYYSGAVGRVRLSPPS